MGEKRLYVLLPWSQSVAMLYLSNNARYSYSYSYSYIGIAI